jgi:hypothetical protein
MTYPLYLKERARWLRITKRLSLDEIAERLALPKTNLYYWIRDLPLGGAEREQPSGDGRLRVMCVTASDTLLRARMQAWTGRVREDWGLDSATPFGA